MSSASQPAQPAIGPSERPPAATTGRRKLLLPPAADGRLNNNKLPARSPSPPVVLPVLLRLLVLRRERPVEAVPLLLELHVVRSDGRTDLGEEFWRVGVEMSEDGSAAGRMGGSGGASAAALRSALVDNRLSLPASGLRLLPASQRALCCTVQCSATRGAKPSIGGGSGHFLGRLASNEQKFVCGGFSRMAGVPVWWRA